MSVNGFLPDDNVIKVDVTDSANERAERGCDVSLVNGWRVFDSHRHYDPFV